MKTILIGLFLAFCLAIPAAAEPGGANREAKGSSGVSSGTSGMEDKYNATWDEIPRGRDVQDKAKPSSRGKRGE